MTQQPDTVQHSRRFVIRRTGEPDIHGIEFPSGRVLADHGETGLFAATSVDVLTEDGGTVHWVDDDTTEEPTPVTATRPGDGWDSTEWDPIDDWRDITDLPLPDDTDQEQT